MLRAAVLSILVVGPALGSPADELSVRLDRVRVVQITVSPSNGTASTREFTRGGGCPPVTVAHTDSTFEPGQYIVQAGFEEHEAAGASYVLSQESFPVHFLGAEILFATANATTQTTTEWSFDVWQGMPGAGAIIASFASDGTLLPHLTMPPGTSGTILQIIVDINDAEQIFIEDNGTNTFAVDFRIEAHHSPGNPCLSPPDPQANAFPTTDISGLDSPTGNWIDAIDGPWCVCGSGWFSFQDFPNICTPSGDWVMRTTYVPADCPQPEAACCLTDGTCLAATQTDCDALNGDWTDPGVSCDDTDCQLPAGACCVESTGACVEVDEVTCLNFGGIFTMGTTCVDLTCFPEGACCTTLGDCVGPLAPDDCEGLGGLFMGDGTECASVTCPEPVGWCCPEDGSFCTEQTESICDAFGAVWGGPGTTCDDTDACNAEPCPGDVNGSGAIDVDDILMVLSGWGSDGGGDADGDGDVDVDDLLLVISGFGPC